MDERRPPFSDAVQEVMERHASKNPPGDEHPSGLRDAIDFSGGRAGDVLSPGKGWVSVQEAAAAAPTLRSVLYDAVLKYSPTPILAVEADRFAEALEHVLSAWLSVVSEGEIEAAAAELANYEYRPDGETWDDLDEVVRTEYRRIVLPVLVAARSVLAASRGVLLPKETT